MDPWKRCTMGVILEDDSFSCLRVSLSIQFLPEDFLWFAFVDHIMCLSWSTRLCAPLCFFWSSYLFPCHSPSMTLVSFTHTSHIAQTCQPVRPPKGFLASYKDDMFMLLEEVAVSVLIPICKKKSKHIIIYIFCLSKQESFRVYSLWTYEVCKSKVGRLATQACDFVLVWTAASFRFGSLTL